MKLRILPLTSLAILLHVSATQAAPLKWDAGVNSNWDTATANWTGSKWINGGDALFDGAGVGTVTLFPDVSAGSLTFNKAGYTLSSGTLALDGDAPVITAGASAAIACVLTSQTASKLTKAGPGTLVLSATNSLNGDTIIKEGVLEIAPTGKLYSVWTPASKVVTVGAGATLRVSGWGGYGDGGFGELDQLQCENPDALVLDGGTLEFTGAAIGFDSTRAFSVGPGGATLKNSSSKNHWVIDSGTGTQAMIVNNSSLTLDGSGESGEIHKNITGGGSLAKSGSGGWVLMEMNSYTGATIVNSGTLRIGGPAGTFGFNSAVTLADASGAALQSVYWNGSKNVGINFSIGSLAGGGSKGGDVDLVTGTMTVGGDNSSSTFGGAICSTNVGGDNPKGTGAIIKTGEGTLTLTGSCSYNGPTTVNQGVLQVLGSLSSDSAVTVSDRGIIRGTGTIGGPLAVHGILAPGTRASAGSLTVSNTVNLTGTTVMRVGRAGAGPLNDSVVAATRVTFGGELVVTNGGAAPFTEGDTFTLFSSVGYGGAFSRMTFPVLPIGLQWDSSKLSGTGGITVIRKR